MSKVAVVFCDDYDKVDLAIGRAIGLLGGINSFVKKNQKILIKPNLCDPLPPDKAATTHPKVAKSVIGIVLGAGAIPVVGELAAGGMFGRTEESFVVTGMKDVCTSSGTRLVDFQKGCFVQQHIREYRFLEKTDFAEVVLDSDAIINLPKLKTHGACYLTGCVKNFFGCVHPEEREYIHSHGESSLNHGVADIFSVVKNKVVLNIMDAVVAMEGDEGPSYGSPRNLGYIIASADAVAADAVAAKITNHNPMEIPIINDCHHRRLGCGILNDIEIVGDGFRQLLDFKVHTNYLNRHDKDKKSKLQPVTTSACTRCSACEKSCPAQAISYSKDKARFEIDQIRCIKCYCCLEVCIFAAIKLETSARPADLIRLGLNCNHKCLFCTVGLDSTPDLSTKEVMDLIDVLAANGSQKLAFTGGEPTLRPDLFALVAYAKTRGIKIIELQTNASEISKAGYAKAITDAGISHFMVAMHSDKEEVYNKLTQSRNFKKAVAGVKNLLKFPVTITISHVINSENYKCLESFVNFVHSEFFAKPCIYFGFVRPNGTAKANNWIVPKMSLVEPYLHKAFAKCAALGIVFSVEGLPLCYMQGYEQHNDETRRLLCSPAVHLEAGVARDDTHKRHLVDNKEEAECCYVCSLSKLCPRVWKEYSDIYGTGELFPVFDEKLKDSLKVFFIG